MPFSLNPIKLLTSTAGAYCKMFTPPSLTEVAAKEAEAAALQVIQCNAVITQHQFIKHMARAKLEALKAWDGSEHNPDNYTAAP